MLKRFRRPFVLSLYLALYHPVWCAAGNAKLQVRAPFRMERVHPTAKLDAVHIPLRPTEAALQPMLVRKLLMWFVNQLSLLAWCPGGTWLLVAVDGSA